MNIIADIAGEYDTFLALLKKMPDEEVISLGDMVDRGRQSREVLEWFMKHGKAVMGNHEHMMLDSHRGCSFYGQGLWEYNGGGRTLDSFNHGVPEEVLTWIEFLPKYMIIDDVFLSHAFIHDSCKNLNEALDFGKNAMDYQCDRNIIWNRDEPVRQEKYRLQLCGHNSQFGLCRWADEEGEYAICLDDSRKKVLTGLHLPTMTIYQQDYIR